MFLTGRYTERVIDAELARFLEDGVGIHLGTRDERLQPLGARAAAVKVDDDGSHFVVFIAETAAARLLPHLRANGRAAVVFGRPTDERACQVKGTFESLRPASPDERTFVAAQFEGYRTKLEAIGIPRALSAAWLTWPAVAIRLEATAVFEQTPGGTAGTQLR